MQINSLAHGIIFQGFQSSSIGISQSIQTVSISQTQININIINASNLFYGFSTLAMYFNQILMSLYLAMLGSMTTSMQVSQVNLSLLSISKTHQLADDKFGVGKGMGANRKSNLAHSPEVVIALHSILKSGRAKSIEQVKEILKKEFGIEAEITKINGRKALRFANGDYIVDSNGNNTLDMGDYNFKGAIKELSKRYGVDINKLKPEEIKALVERLKASKIYGNYNMLFANLNITQGSFFSSFGTGMLTAPEILYLFATAYQLAV